MLYVLTQPKSLPEKYQPRPSFLDLTPLRYPLWIDDDLETPKMQLHFKTDFH